MNFTDEQIEEAATEAARGWAFDGGSGAGEAHLYLRADGEATANTAAVPEGA